LRPAFNGYFIFLKKGMLKIPFAVYVQTAKGIAIINFHSGITLCG
jgi:hypothetical protein